MRIQEWVSDLLGFQAFTQFGAQYADTQHVSIQSQTSESVDCSSFYDDVPNGFEHVSLAAIRNNLAVMPSDWKASGVKRPWNRIEGDSSIDTCLSHARRASFVAFDDSFFKFIGLAAKLEKIHSFSGVDVEHVHEAPVYLPNTDEFVFADTSVVGWLWALEVGEKKMRKVRTNPPLANVNGATMKETRMYVTTNGGQAPAVWNCSLPDLHAWQALNHQRQGATSPIEGVDIGDLDGSETIQCELVVNNYRLAHLNSPNDLVFTSRGNVLFTDPTYGWAQSWPGVGPPELPTATYHFNTRTSALIALDNSQILQPNGLVLSPDESTLYVADSNSTSGKPIGVWEDSVRNIYAFDFDESKLVLTNRRLVHVVESGWPDGLRVTTLGKSGSGEERLILLVACMGGVDVVDVSNGGAGVLLGKWNVGDDIAFNLERANPKTGNGWQDGRERWLLTGKQGVYQVTVSPQQ